jgi:hypothetical protein
MTPKEHRRDWEMMLTGMKLMSGGMHADGTRSGRLFVDLFLITMRVKQAEGLGIMPVMVTAILADHRTGLFRGHLLTSIYTCVEGRDSGSTFEM